MMMSRRMVKGATKYIKLQGVFVGSHLGFGLVVGAAGLTPVVACSRDGLASGAGRMPAGNFVTTSVFTTFVSGICGLLDICFLLNRGI